MKPPSFAAWLVDRFGSDTAISGDLLEQAANGRSRLWLWIQVIAAIGHSTAAAIRADPRTAARTAIGGAGVLAIGAQVSLWTYLWATNHLAFHWWMNTTWFVLAWHSYELPLNASWCATSLAAGRIIARVDGHRRVPFAVIAGAVQVPVLIWFAWPAIQAAVRVTHPPTLLRYRAAFVVDALWVTVVMPTLTLAAALKGRPGAALKGCTTNRTTEKAAPPGRATDD